MDAPPIRFARTSDGCDIALATTGEGPPLLLCWGFAELRLRWTSALFNRFFERLAESNELIQYDPRGQGLSTHDLPTTTVLHDFALDLEALVEQLGMKRITLLGLTRMAKVALKFAVENPTLVRALVLWNCDPSAPHYGAYGSGRRLALSNWAYQIETSARTTFPQEDYEVHLRMKTELMTPNDFLVTLDALDQEISETDLRRLNVPTLVLGTRASAWSFAAEEPSRRLASLIPGATLAIYDDVGGGLFSFADEVPPGVRAIREFIRRPQADERHGRELLSAREQEVMRLVYAGNSNLQIAHELCISKNTVRRHVANILAKLGATNRTQAVASVRDHGMP